jgi:hypothetical protein
MVSMSGYFSWYYKIEKRNRLSRNSKIMSKSQYIAVHKKYELSPQSGLLIDRILSALHVIVMNDNNPNGYPVDDSDRMNAYEMERYIRSVMREKKMCNLELYFVENEEVIMLIHTYLSCYLISNKNQLVYYEYDDENLPRCDNIAHTKYIKKEVWLEELYGIMLHLDEILDSFDYDYEEMRIEGKELFNELRKYVGNPCRIERIASSYKMDLCEYLDIIDL